MRPVGLGCETCYCCGLNAFKNNYGDFSDLVDLLKLVQGEQVLVLFGSADDGNHVTFMGVGSQVGCVQRAKADLRCGSQDGVFAAECVYLSSSRRPESFPVRTESLMRK